MLIKPSSFSTSSTSTRAGEAGDEEEMNEMMSKKFVTGKMSDGVSMMKSFLKFAAVVFVSGSTLHLLAYLLEPHFVAFMFPPPRVTCELDTNICTPGEKEVISIDYSRHPIKDELEGLCPSTPVLVYGPGNVGKSTCIRKLVQHLQSQGEYAIYIPLRLSAPTILSPNQNRPINLDEHIFSFIDPKLVIARPAYLNSRFLGEDKGINRFLESCAARGKPVRLFIDDAQKLTKDSPCLGPLLEYILGNRLQVVFISSNDDASPAFVESSGYHTRYEAVRFEQDGALVMDALKKTGYGDADLKLLSDSVGYAIGDIATVLKTAATTNTNLTDALDKVLLRRAKRIQDTVTASVKAGDPLIPAGSTMQIRRETFEFLSKLSFDPSLASSIETVTSDPEQSERMEMVAKKLAEANILSFIGGNTYTWHTQSFATAFAKYMSPRRGYTGMTDRGTD